MKLRPAQMRSPRSSPSSGPGTLAPDRPTRVVPCRDVQTRKIASSACRPGLRRPDRVLRGMLYSAEVSISYEPRGCSSMVEQKPSKLMTRVRFPSPAPIAVLFDASWGPAEVEPERSICDSYRYPRDAPEIHAGASQPGRILQHSNGRMRVRPGRKRHNETDIRASLLNERTKA